MGKVKGYAPYPVSYDPELNKRYHEIVCDGCGATDRMSTAASSGLPVLKIAKTFGNRGWDVDTKNMGHGKCAECQRQEKESKKLRLVHPKPVPLEPAMAALTQNYESKEPKPLVIEKPAAEAPKAMGLEEMLIVQDAVDTHYDPKIGYTGDYNDQKIADELKCPLDWVRTFRTKKYGKMPETAEIVAIRKDIQTLAVAIDTLKTNMGYDDRAFHERIDKLKKEHKEHIERMDLRTIRLANQQAELTKKLDDALAKL